MSRIDASIATQVGDASRPQQQIIDRQQQANLAITKAVTDGVDAGQTLTAEDARAVATRLKQVVETAGTRRLSFNVDQDDANELYMQVTDLETGEVIRQIPSKEMRDLHARLQEPLGSLLDRVGLLLDKKG